MVYPKYLKMFETSLEENGGTFYVGDAVGIGIQVEGSRKFSQRGSKFDNFFLVDEGLEDPKTSINGPSSAGQ